MTRAPSPYGDPRLTSAPAEAHAPGIRWLG